VEADPQRTQQQIKEDNVPLLAAGVAFYIFIALFPALIAAVTIYGLVSDPAEVEQQVAGFAGSLPSGTAELIETQLKDIASNSGGSLGIGLLASLAGALFAASGGMQNLIKAINIAYDEEETRNFIKLRLVALAMTLALIAFLVVAVGLVAVLPVVLERVAPDGIAKVGVQIARWLGLFAFVALCLAALYRYAPTATSRSSSGWASAASWRPCCGSSARPASRCTSACSAATTRPTAHWPASSCCCSGCS
jgi:membrane protein